MIHFIHLFLVTCSVPITVTLCQALLCASVFMSSTESLLTMAVSSWWALSESSIPLKESLKETQSYFFTYWFVLTFKVIYLSESFLLCVSCTLSRLALLCTCWTWCWGVMDHGRSQQRHRIWRQHSLPPAGFWTNTEEKLQGEMSTEYWERVHKQQVRLRWLLLLQWRIMGVQASIELW